MADLRAEIENLDSDLKIQYVFARSKTTSNNKAVDDAGFSQSTFYGWDQDERDRLNKLAMRLKTEAGLRALLILQEYVEEAAEGLGGLLKSRNENIKIKAQTEILDRVRGKPTQKIDQKTEHTVQLKQYETISPDDWDNLDAEDE